MTICWDYVKHVRHCCYCILFVFTVAGGNEAAGDIVGGARRTAGSGCTGWWGGWAGWGGQGGGEDNKDGEGSQEKAGKRYSTNVRQVELKSVQYSTCIIHFTLQVEQYLLAFISCQDSCWGAPDGGRWLVTVWRGSGKCGGWGPAPDVEKCQDHDDTTTTTIIIRTSNTNCTINSISDNFNANGCHMCTWYFTASGITSEGEGWASKCFGWRGVRNWACPRCNTIRGSKNSCDAHIRQAHTGKVLACALCSFSTYNLYSLQRHAKTHN